MPVPLTLPVAYGRRQPPSGAPLRRGTPIGAAVSQCWPMWEGTGAPQNICFRRAKATATGGSWRAAPTGRAWTVGTGFDANPGQSNYDGVWPPPRLSVVALVLPTTGATYQAILGGVNGTAIPELRLNTSNQLEFLNQNTTLLGTSTGTVAPNAWHLIGLSYDGGSGAGSFYVDGRPAGTFSNAVTFSGGKPTPGSNSDSTEFWNGAFALLFVTRRPLLPAEHARLWAAPFGSIF